MSPPTPPDVNIDWPRYASQLEVENRELREALRQIRQMARDMDGYANNNWEAKELERIVDVVLAASSEEPGA